MAGRQGTANRGRKDFFFVNKKARAGREAKKTLVLRAVAAAMPRPAGAKVLGLSQI
jgi:hypothetical protein